MNTTHNKGGCGFSFLELILRHIFGLGVVLYSPIIQEAGLCESRMARINGYIWDAVVVLTHYWNVYFIMQAGYRYLLKLSRMTLPTSFFLNIYMGVWAPSKSMHHMCAVHGGRKRTLDPLGLGLETFVWHEGAGGAVSPALVIFTF